MRYKALILDVDGTVVPFGLGNMPSKQVEEAIFKAKDKIHICLATGRILENTQYLLDIFELSGPCILDQGAQIYDPIQKRMLREITLDTQIAWEIYQCLRSFSIPVTSYDGSKDSEATDERIRGKVVGIWSENYPVHLEQEVLRALKKFSNIAVHRIGGTRKECVSVEINHSTATKQHGIQEVANLLRISTHEMIGVGDGYNDYPLLSACGLKIAMGNAVPELKAIADFIAPTVEEDGVATVIEKFILNT